MLDKLIATIAAAFVAGSLLIIAFKVPHPDLLVVIALCIAMVIYDFTSHFLEERRQDSQPD